MMEFFLFLKKARICSRNYLGQETRKGTKEATGEHRLGCSGSLGRQRKGSRGDRVRALTRTSVHCSPGASFTRTTGIKNYLSVRKGEGKGLAGACSLEEEHHQLF